MSKLTLPTIESNYTPLPHRFLERIFTGAMSREEIIVSLYCFYRGYGWKPDHGYVRADTVARDTGLPLTAARMGLSAACERGTLLPLPNENTADQATDTFVLNTEQNRRFIETYCSSESQSEQPAPPEDEDIEPWTPMDDSSPAIPYDDEIEQIADASSDSPTLPFHDKTVEMLVRIIGRPLTKDERERLADVQATDDEFIHAMRSLLSKTSEVYSSDLVIYEYERLCSLERRALHKERAKEQREQQIERQRKCMKCEGLGYIFAGLNNIIECDCKKEPK